MAVWSQWSCGLHAGVAAWNSRGVNVSTYTEDSRSRRNAALVGNCINKTISQDREGSGVINLQTQQEAAPYCCRGLRSQRWGTWRIFLPGLLGGRSPACRQGRALLRSYDRARESSPGLLPVETTARYFVELRRRLPLSHIIQRFYFCVEWSCWLCMSNYNSTTSCFQLLTTFWT